MNLEDYSLIGKALSDITRLKIVEILKSGNNCACILLEEFKITQPTLSYHMKTLVESRLVTCTKEGKWCHYSLNQDILNDFINYLSAKKIVVSDEN